MPDKLTNSKLYLFLYTMKEYQRFSGELCSHELTADYDAESYVQINTKLILLRKYGSKGEPVFIEEILDEMKKTYPHKSEEASKILNEYHEIINMQIEQILADGTKLNLYQTIEDVMYGLYLHADANRIQRLVQTDEQLRFTCIRKYVEDFEKVLFKIIKCLRECGMDVEEIHKEHASIIAFGNQSERHNDVNLPFWSNIYWHDADDEELKQIYRQLVPEDIEILIRCNIFLEELKKDVISVDLLDKLIFPSTKKDWKDYSEAREFFLGIKNPGISSKVRYNEQHTMAYVRIHPNVEDAFVINSPHIINDIYEISLVKDYGMVEWKIYSFVNVNEKIYQSLAKKFTTPLTKKFTICYWKSLPLWFKYKGMPVVIDIPPDVSRKAYQLHPRMH